MRSEQGDLFYRLAPQGVKVGDSIDITRSKGFSLSKQNGRTLPLSSIQAGTLIHGIESKPGQGATICRSAGCFAKLLFQRPDQSGLARVELPSKEQILLSSDCFLQTSGI